jgi:type I restriction enzyme S subunit
MDTLIAAQRQKVEALKERKRGLMQQLFLQQGETTPRLRFPGFTDNWQEKKLCESFTERVEKRREDLPLLSLGEEGLAYQSDTARKDNSNQDKSKYLRVAIGDIAYNTMRMWQGRCVYVDIEGIVSPAYTVCKPKRGIDSRFHYYLFKTHRMISKFHQHSQGLVSDTLNLKYHAFSKIKYLLPPSLAEQEKIAAC